VALPPSYIIQARGDVMVVFSVFLREIGPIQEEGG